MKCDRLVILVTLCLKLLNHNSRKLISADKVVSYLLPAQFGCEYRDNEEIATKCSHYYCGRRSELSRGAQGEVSQGQGRRGRRTGRRQWHLRVPGDARLIFRGRREQWRSEPLK